jgi:hypothetical protein
MSVALTRRLFVCAVVLLIGYEAYALHQFVSELRPSVEIQGEGQLLIEDFGNGVPVEQVFTMRAAGLSGVSVLLAADRPISLRAQCELRQVHEEVSGAETLLYRWTTDLGRVSGTEWHRIDFPPLPGSDRRLYAFRVQVEKPAAIEANSERNSGGPTTGGGPSRLKVAIAASAARVPGAGRFLVGADPWDGSLFLRAHAEGETAYDQFQRTIDTRLPRPLRSRLVQAGLVIAYHWALLTYAYAMLIAGGSVLQGETQPGRSRAMASL